MISEDIFEFISVEELEAILEECPIYGLETEV